MRGAYWPCKSHWFKWHVTRTGRCQHVSTRELRIADILGGDGTHCFAISSCLWSDSSTLTVWNHREELLTDPLPLMRMNLWAYAHKPKNDTFPSHTSQLDSLLQGRLHIHLFLKVDGKLLKRHSIVTNEWKFNGDQRNSACIQEFSWEIFESFRESASFLMPQRILLTIFGLLNHNFRWHQTKCVK